MKAALFKTTMRLDIISEKIVGRIKDSMLSHPTLLAINDIMDDIHREVTSKAGVPKAVENK